MNGPPPGSKPRPGPRPWLLLVDDEPDFLKGLVRFFAARGLGPATASDGGEALALLEGGGFEVVVSDVMMPVMGGLELTRRIKELEPEIEVILITGGANVGDGVAGIKSGAYDYLSKPLEPEHLLGKVTQAREKLATARELRRQVEFRARVEKQLEAAQRLAALGTLASGVAHEINNPLAVIRQTAQWMDLVLSKPEMEGFPRRGELQEALAKIFASVQRAAGITHQLLGFARQDPPRAVEIGLDRLVRESMGLVEQEARTRGVELRLIPGGEGETVWADPGRFRQILINLLTNALQASRSGQTVEVTAGTKGGEVVVEVRDWGPGIPGEDLDRLFEPFFTTKPQGQGTGLGLFVSQNLADKLGGRIEVESRLGGGARFTLRLPNRPPAEPAPLGGHEDRLNRAAATFVPQSPKE